MSLQSRIDEFSFDPVLFRQNLLKLIVGIVLLFFSWGYLQWHAAEKASLLSWIRVMSQKMHIMSYKVLGWDVDLLEDKYLTLRRLEENFYTASFVSWCAEWTMIEELETVISDLRALDLSDYDLVSWKYFDYVLAVYRYVSNSCVWDVVPSRTDLD